MKNLGPISSASLFAGLRPVLMFTALLLSLACCKKEEQDPLLACRQATSGNGVGSGNRRSILFWINQNLGCGTIRLVSIRNTETNSPNYAGSVIPTITQFFTSQPACGTAGAITIQVDKGYEYEYVLACTGRQWQGKFTADCNDNCLAILLK